MALAWRELALFVGRERGDQLLQEGFLLYFLVLGVVLELFPSQGMSKERELALAETEGSFLRSENFRALVLLLCL